MLQHPPGFLLCRPFSSFAILTVLLVGGRAAPAEASELRRTAVVKAVEGARLSIVNIHGQKTVSSSAEDPNAYFDGTRRVNGMGTGVVIDPRGYIITNNHVVEGVRKIEVTLADDETFVAQLVSNDPGTDLAVIKIDTPEKLPVIRIGTSSDLMPGEPVIAVGNAFGYENTVTRGIVSALHRSVQVSDTQSYEDLIQTDASINPGNSGGPLLNIDGEMIGINVAVRAGAQGIGFAIPVDKAMSIAAKLMSVTRLENTWHGVTAQNGDSSKGMIVAAVEKESPAAQVGLQAGDLIVGVEDLEVDRPLDFERALLGHRAGEQVMVAIERQNKPLTMTMTLASLPKRDKVDSDPTWEVLGMKLAPIPAAQFRTLQSRYRGGLSVQAVRADGPAARQGIRRGDVLVGMHIWETVSPDNVSYILNRPDFAQLDPLKFYILRGNETLYGHLSVAMKSN